MKRANRSTTIDMQKERKTNKRKCTSCNKVKSLSQYGSCSNGANGKRRQCKECRNNYRKKRYKTNPEYYKKLKEQRRSGMLKIRYGITSKEYDSMLKQQNNKCAICHKDSNYMSKRLAVDHCHKTGKIRALLCDSCNNILGRAKDDPDLLLRCSEYLLEYQGSYT